MFGGALRGKGLAKSILYQVAIRNGDREVRVQGEYDPDCKETHPAHKDWRAIAEENAEKLGLSTPVVFPVEGLTFTCYSEDSPEFLGGLPDAIVG
jgi:hypothetical protein